MLPSTSYERYARQMLLTQLGRAGQDKLRQARVAVIGAGGLGCPVLQYLAAAGIGTLGIVDDDTVALHNLHRQVLFGMDDLGKQKTFVAAAKLAALNPDVQVETFPTQITNQNAWDMLSSFDVVVDGSDNFPTRYMVNDVCNLLQKPLVYGSISRFEGQVGVFHVAGEDGRKTTYRDLFPVAPAPGEVSDCAEAGVLGVLPGIIGSMMANEALKLVAGFGQPLINRVLIYNALNNASYETVLSPALHSTGMPTDRRSFEAMTYGESCAASSPEISADTFDRLRSDPGVTIVDVREHHETPAISDFPCQQIPMSVLTSDSLPGNNTLVVVCQSGVRSRKAAALLATGGRQVFSLQGGIIAWQNRKQQA